MEDKLQRYFNHLLNEQEKKELFEEMKRNELLREEFITLRNLYALTGTQPHEGDKEYAATQYNQLTGKIRKHTIRRVALQIARYAAVILITAGIYTFYNHSTKTVTEDLAWSHIEVPSGQRTYVSLPDGTGVWLNAQSTLSYPAGYSASNRLVTLKGEAYFEVTSDEKNPFTIQTDQMNVTVLGTKFNLKSYPEENEQVTLFEGKVEVNIAGGQGSVTLQPNEQAFISLSGNLEVKQFSGTHDIRAWTNGDFFYLDEPLDILMKDLERRFNTRIIIQDENLTKERYTYRADEGISLEQILRHLQGTKELNYISHGDYIEIVKY